MINLKKDKTLYEVSYQKENVTARGTFQQGEDNGTFLVEIEILVDGVRVGFATYEIQAGGAFHQRFNCGKEDSKTIVATTLDEIVQDIKSKYIIKAAV